MKHKLEKFKSSSLMIYKDDVRRDYKMYGGTTKVKITAWQQMPSGKVLTGLTEKEEKYFEEALNLEEGELSPKSKFWHTYGIYLTAEGKYLDDEIPEDALAVKVLLAREDLVDSISEARKKANVNYILTTAEKESETNVDRRTWLVKALALYNEMNAEQKKEFLIQNNDAPCNMSPKVIDDKVGAYAESNPKKFVALVEHPNKKELVFINELLNFGVIKRIGSHYEDLNKTTLAHSMDDMVVWIKDPANSAVVTNFKKQLRSAKKE